MDEDFLHDLFAEFGAIEIRRMFSGRGIYAGGVIFGIISRDGAIHLKTDETTRAAYERDGAKPLTFTRKSGERMVTSYWRLPERLYDDPGELAEWARDALRVARAFTAGKSAARKKKPAGAKAGANANAKPVIKPSRKSKKKKVARSASRKKRVTRR